MRTALFLLVLTSVHFWAAVVAHAQSGRDPAPGIDANCAINPAAPQGDTVLFFARFGLFLQSSASQVAPDPRSIHVSSGTGASSSPFSASMMFFSGTNSATAPLLRRGAWVYAVPDTGGNGTMTNYAFATESALAAGFPADSYSAQYSAEDGSINSVALALADFNLPTPTIANFDQLQSFPVGQAFTVRWLPFGNANVPNSSITLRIEEIDDYGDVVKTVFLAPNYCTNILLRPTDAEITVPAGILQPGIKYQGELCFGRLAYARQATAPSLLFETSDSKQTRFPLGGAVVPAPSIAVESIVPAGDGKYTVRLRVTGAPSVIVDTSVDLVYWEFYVLKAADPGGVTTFDFTPAASEQTRFYRVRTYQ
jgi:hypothetical protein